MATAQRSLHSSGLACQSSSGPPRTPHSGSKSAQRSGSWSMAGVCALRTPSLCRYLPQTYASMGLAVLDCRADAVIKLPDVAAAVALVGRLAAVGGVGLIVEVPGLVGLGGLLPEAPEEDVEDALSDMVRAGLEAGADAVAVRGQPEGDVGHTVDAVLSLAEFDGAQVIGIDGGRGWSGSGLCAVSLLGRDGAWPDVARGLIFTAGDVTEWWTPDEMRALLRGRGDAVPGEL